MFKPKYIMLVFLIASQRTIALDFYNSIITAVRPDNFNIGGVFVKLEGNGSGAQSCSYPNTTGQHNWYFISSENALMDQLLSVSLSAKLTSASVTIVGNSVCHGGYEDVRYIQIN